MQPSSLHRYTTYPVTAFSSSTAMCTAVVTQVHWRYSVMYGTEMCLHQRLHHNCMLFHSTHRDGSCLKVLKVGSGECEFRDTAHSKGDPVSQGAAYTRTSHCIDCSIYRSRGNVHGGA